MDHPLKVLILEDRVSDADLVEFELQEAEINYTSKRVTCENEYVKGLQEFSPDLILSDYDLPHYNGALALNEARRRCPDVPFILVTGAIGEDRAIEILTQGAKDYVLKNRMQRLVPAVRRALAEAEGYREHKKAEENLANSNRHLEQLLKEQTQVLNDLNRELQEKNRDRNIICKALKTYQHDMETQKNAFQLARRKLEETLNRRVALYDSSPAGYFTFDEDGLVTHVNSTGAKMLGIKQARLMNTPFYLYISPALRNTFYFYTRKVMLTGENESWELELLKSDGTTFMASVECFAVPNVEHRKTYLHTIITDISKAKKIEGAVHISDREWRLAFDAIADPVWIIDSNAIITCCNKATTKFINRNLNEIIGRKCFEILHGTSAPVTDCPAVSTMASGKRSSVSLQLCEMPVNITTDALRNESGQIIGSVHILSHGEDHPVRAENAPTNRPFLTA